MGTTKADHGKDFDAGISELKWKAAAERIKKCLSGEGVVEPAALDNQIKSVKQWLQSYTDTIAEYGIAHPAEAGHEHMSKSLCDDGARIVVSGAIGALLLNPPNDKLLAFRSLRKLTKRVTTESIPCMHAGLIEQAQKNASVK